MPSARLTVVVECDDAIKADEFVKKLEDAIGNDIDEVQAAMDFYPEGQGEADSDEGIFIVATLSDETALETD